MDKLSLLSKVRGIYEANSNIMQYLREISGSKMNSADDIMIEDSIRKMLNVLNTEDCNVVYGNNSISFNIQSTHGGELEITDDNSTSTVTKSGNTVTVSNLSTLSSGTKVKVSIKCAETDN